MLISFAEIAIIEATVGRPVEIFSRWCIQDCRPRPQNPGHKINGARWRTPIPSCCTDGRIPRFNHRLVLVQWLKGNVLKAAHGADVVIAAAAE